MSSESRVVVRMRTIALAVCVVVAFGCKNRQVREWTPRDHDPDGSVENTGQTAVSPNDDPLATARALFMAQCASCHGPEGHGDGPMAMMFRPADLSDPAIQGARTDEDLANAITRGKGRMPAFGNQLRPEAVPMLVRFVRSLRR